METFDFCPNGRVPKTRPREVREAMSLGGWQFNAKPNTPYQRRFVVMLHGLRWIFNEEDDEYDLTTDPTVNAHRLEKFYEAHEGWRPFTFDHPHLGPLTVRFAAAVEVPLGLQNSDGFVEAFEIQLIEHNPGYST